MTTRYFEDWQVGDTFDTRGATVTESQIVDFALLYDPQPMHLDRTFAAEGMFGELIASGFHTLSISFRLFYDTGYVAHSNIIGVGLDELRWTAPVRPGDTLRCRVEIVALTPSRSKPDRGTMSFKAKTLNQRDEEVLHYTSTCILRRRPADAEPS